jgi:hypothetical protein
VSDEEFTAKREELVLAQTRAKEGLRRVELPAIDPREAVDRFISFCKDLEAVFERGSDNEIRELLRIVGSNYEIGGKEVHFEPVEPFTMATQARRFPQWQASEEDVRKIVASMQGLKH